MSELKWYWVYVPYLDPPDRQQESALRAGYNKVCFKYDADTEIRKAKRAMWLARLQALNNFSVLGYFERNRAKGKRSRMDDYVMACRIDIARVKCRAKAEEYK